MLGVDLVLGGLLVLWGSRLDRLGAGLYMLGSCVGIGATLLKVPELFSITFVNTVLLFLIFWQLAERAERWWMVAMAGFQLVSLLTYVVPTYEWERLKEAFIQFHWALAVMHLGCLVLGIFEVRWARQQAGDGADGALVDPRNRP